MDILNIAGYKFIALTALSERKNYFLKHCTRLDLKGTILLSLEGININLSGMTANILAFKNILQQEALFSGLLFHESFSAVVAFRKLKIKIKKEIITLRQPQINAVATRAPQISPQELKQWLDEKRALTLLDTRNDYEVQLGTFVGAKQLHLADFNEFPQAAQTLAKDKPIVLFCTGGIRCEKAALYMQEQGYEQVYQLDGGILGYFAQVGAAHYTGTCFVFDERVAVDSGAFGER